jgi:predicted HicB family RNase H-like nuclease
MKIKKKIQCNDFTAYVYYSNRDKLWYGKWYFISDVMFFTAIKESQLIKNFKESIKNYLNKNG